MAKRTQDWRYVNEKLGRLRPNAANTEGETLAHLFAQYDRDQDLLRFIEMHAHKPAPKSAAPFTPVDLNARDNNKNTPLHIAIKYSSLKVMRLLIAQRCDCGLKAGGPYKKLSVFHLAIQNNNIKVIKELLKMRQEHLDAVKAQEEEDEGSDQDEPTDNDNDNDNTDNDNDNDNDTPDEENQKQADQEVQDLIQGGAQLSLGVTPSNDDNSTLGGSARSTLESNRSSTTPGRGRGRGRGRGGRGGGAKRGGGGGRGRGRGRGKRGGGTPKKRPPPLVGGLGRKMTQSLMKKISVPDSKGSLSRTPSSGLSRKMTSRLFGNKVAPEGTLTPIQAFEQYEARVGGAVTIDVNAVDAKKNSPLNHAIITQEHSVDIPNLLLEFGEVNPWLNNNLDKNALCLAVEYGHPNLAKTLLEKGFAEFKEKKEKGEEDSGEAEEESYADKIQKAIPFCRDDNTRALLQHQLLECMTTRDKRKAASQLIMFSWLMGILFPATIVAGLFEVRRLDRLLEKIIDITVNLSALFLEKYHSLLEAFRDYKRRRREEREHQKEIERMQRLEKQREKEKRDHEKKANLQALDNDEDCGTLPKGPPKVAFTALDDTQNPSPSNNNSSSTNKDNNSTTPIANTTTEKTTPTPTSTDTSLTTKSELTLKSEPVLKSPKASDSKTPKGSDLKTPKSSDSSKSPLTEGTTPKASDSKSPLSTTTPASSTATKSIAGLLSKASKIDTDKAKDDKSKSSEHKESPRPNMKALTAITKFKKMKENVEVDPEKEKMKERAKLLKDSIKPVSFRVKAFLWVYLCLLIFPFLFVYGIMLPVSSSSASPSTVRDVALFFITLFLAFSTVVTLLPMVRAFPVSIYYRIKNPPTSFRQNRTNLIASIGLFVEYWQLAAFSMGGTVFPANSIASTIINAPLLIVSGTEGIITTTTISYFACFLWIFISGGLATALIVPRVPALQDRFPWVSKQHTQMLLEKPWMSFLLVLLTDTAFGAIVDNLFIALDCSVSSSSVDVTTPNYANVTSAINMTTNGNVTSGNITTWSIVSYTTTSITSQVLAMDADPSLLCWDNERHRLSAMASLFALVTFVPSATVLLLLLSDPDEDPESDLDLQLIWIFQLVDISIKFLLALISTFMDAAPKAALPFAFILMALFLFVVPIIRWKHPKPPQHPLPCPVPAVNTGIYCMNLCVLWSVIAGATSTYGGVDDPVPSNVLLTGWGVLVVGAIVYQNLWGAQIVSSDEIKAHWDRPPRQQHKLNPYDPAFKSAVGGAPLKGAEVGVSSLWVERGRGIIVLGHYEKKVTVFKYREPSKELEKEREEVNQPISMKDTFEKLYELSGPFNQKVQSVYSRDGAVVVGEGGTTGIRLWWPKKTAKNPLLKYKLSDVTHLAMSKRVVACCNASSQFSLFYVPMLHTASTAQVDGPEAFLKLDASTFAPDKVSQIRFHPTASEVYLLANRSLFVVDTSFVDDKSSKKILSSKAHLKKRIFLGEKIPPFCFSLSPGAAHLWVGCADTYVHQFDFASLLEKSEDQSIAEPQDSLPKLALTGGGGEDLPASHSGGVRALFEEPKHEILATLSDDQTVMIWDLETGKPLSCVKDFDKPLLKGGLLNHYTLVALYGNKLKVLDYSSQAKSEAGATVIDMPAVKSQDEIPASKLPRIFRILRLKQAAKSEGTRQTKLKMLLVFLKLAKKAHKEEELKEKTEHKKNALQKLKFASKFGDAKKIAEDKPKSDDTDAISPANVKDSKESKDTKAKDSKDSKAKDSKEKEPKEKEKEKEKKEETSSTKLNLAADSTLKLPAGDSGPKSSDRQKSTDQLATSTTPRAPSSNAPPALQPPSAQQPSARPSSSSQNTRPAVSAQTPQRKAPPSRGGTKPASKKS